MSFANLEKTEQNSQRIYNPIDQLKEETPASTGAAANHDQPFTQEQVEGQWISMCLRMQGIKDFIGLANRMKPIVPTITDFPHIEVVIDNKLLLDEDQGQNPADLQNRPEQQPGNPRLPSCRNG